MNERLVTIATYASPVEASLAKNYLEAAGLAAFLADEEMVAMAWPLTSAVGEIKLQVADRDADRAVALLAECTSPQGQEPETTGETASPESSAEPQAEDALKDEPEPLLTGREQNADRACRGAVFGLLFWPLQLYVFWLLLKIYLSEEELHPTKRRKVLLAAVINLPLMLAFCLILRRLLTP